jgi:hypothetical protein
MAVALPYSTSFSRVPEWPKLINSLNNKLSKTAQLEFYKYCEQQWKSTTERSERNVPSNYYFPDAVKIYLYVLIKGASIRRVQADLGVPRTTCNRLVDFIENLVPSYCLFHYFRLKGFLPSF